MELVKIHEELINEAAKGPLAAFEYILKAAGKGLAEANSALLKSVQKINPNVKQLFKATPEEVNKALGRLEFKEYRKIIVDYYLTNQKKEIEKILKGFDLTNTQSVKLAKAEIANTLKYKNAIAYDVVERYRPKTRKTTTQSTRPVGNATELSIKYDFVNKELEKLDEYLWNRVNNKGLKRFFLLKRVSRSNWSSYRNELFNHLNKTLSERFEKETKLKLTEVKEFFENLDLNNKKNADKIIDESVRKFNEILNKQAESLGTYGSIFKKFQPDTIASFRNWLKSPGKDTWKTFKEDYADAFKTSSVFMAFGTLGEVLAGDLDSWDKIKNEINLKYTTIVIPGINTWFWGLNALYRWGKVGVNYFNKDEKKSGESGLFNDTDIKTDTEEDKLKRIEGGFENK